ncbi:MAG: hypothetical protein KFKLKKLM_00811 [Flavobacteriales bacterium]|nr:hypothetical protein [Flavobacteriales bacterium]
MSVENVVIEYTNTNRLIHYYDVSFKYYKEINDTFAYKDLLKYISDLSKNQNPSRVVSNSKGKLFTSGFRYLPAKKQVRGKLYFVREDVFPQIIKLSDESIRDFQIDAEEGMLETTHFIIDYSKPVPRIALEYNHHGARINDLVFYLTKMGRQSRLVLRCSSEAIVQDRLKDIKRRINRFSKVRVKVQKENIDRIKSANDKLGSALYHSQNFSLSDDVELLLTFDYKKKTSTTSIKDVVISFIDRFIKNPKTTTDFEVFEIHAEDEDNNNKLEAFNLLIDKVITTISVQKRKKTRVINSKDYYEKSEKEMTKLFKLDW